jgi:MSHA biogenesis protein MshK
MAATVIRLLLPMLLAGSCAAQTLADPTRPPASMQRASGEPAAIANTPQLQSVLIARQPGGRHIAVIDGETVRLGQTWHGAVVARVTETEVELVRGRERQILKLASAAGQTSKATSK